MCSNVTNCYYLSLHIEDINLWTSSLLNNILIVGNNLYTSIRCSESRKKGVGKPNLSIKGKRLLNQRQYQNETRHIIVFTQAFCWKWTFFCACICLSFYTIIGLSCNCFCVVYMKCKTNHIMSWSKILIPCWIYHSEQSTCHVVYYCRR